MTALRTDTVVSREVAWLTAVDALPALLAANGGPFDIVQGYWPGAHYARNKKGVYVLRRRILTPRFGGARIMPGGNIWAKICWPALKTTPGIAEGEQANLDAAVEMLLERVNGLPLDKTHGGRFLSAGETVHPPGGGYPEVEFLDPEVTIPAGQWLRCDVTYAIDDFEAFD